MENSTFKKCGEVTVSVYKSTTNGKIFTLNTDNEEVLPIFNVIEDTLKLY